MYYLVDINFSEVEKSAVLEEEPIDECELNLDWETGDSMSKQREIGHLFAEVSENYGTILRDIFINDFSGVILNRKCIDILKSIGVSNLEEFPLTIKDNNTGKEITNYSMYNIIGILSCVDKQNSEFEYDESTPDQVHWFDKLVIDTKKIDAFNKKLGKNGPIKIFRMAERFYTIIVHEDVKNAIEKEGLTGWTFTRTDKYKG